jgi:hypothetical protein
MNGSRKVTITASVLLVACLAGSIVFLRRIDQLRASATLEDVLFITSPKAVKRLSLGYEGLLADIYWTRAVQYFGGRHVAGASHYRLLAPLLEITTTLDPHLVVAYQFGATFLAPKPPNGAGMPEKAVQLVNYGIENNPNDWKLYYELGFIYYMDVKDYAKAADAFARGSQVPDAHPFLKVMAAQMAQHSGDTQMARRCGPRLIEHTDKQSVAMPFPQLLQVADEVMALEALRRTYTQTTGDPARHELVAANI